MSSPHTDKLKIIVREKYPSNAALMNIDGTRTLILRPQPASSAVRNMRNLLPEIPHEVAERLVRENCPEFDDFDDLFAQTAPTPPSIEDLPLPTQPGDDAAKAVPRSRRRKAVLVAALLPALAASWALGRYTNSAHITPVQVKASAADTAPDAAADAAGVQAPFDDAKFEFFAGSSAIECAPTNVLEAECTDSDGMVMSTKAATGPDSTIFTFSYGSERIGLRIFYDAAYAETWARQDGSRELYPNMRVHGRYVLWGTDPQRIGEYTRLLEEADRRRGPSPVAMGGAEPLPSRLAALTLGTLGLSTDEVHQIIARPAAATADEPAMVAARLVLGLDPAPVLSGPAGDDIVALAAGIEPPPRAPGGAALPVVVPVAETNPPVASPVTVEPVQPEPVKTPQPLPPPATETPAPEPTAPPADPSPEPQPVEEPPAPQTGGTSKPVPPPAAAPPVPQEPAPPAPAPEPVPDPSAPAPEPVPEPPAAEPPEPSGPEPAPPAADTPEPEEAPAAPAPDPADEDQAPPAEPADEDEELLILQTALTVTTA